MHSQNKRDIIQLVGDIPYRMAFAGGWIDQPFVSKHNPNPPGSMVVVSIEPTIPFMQRCGMATSTRKAAMRLWHGRVPDGDRAALVRSPCRVGSGGSRRPFRIAGYGWDPLPRYKQTGL